MESVDDPALLGTMTDILYKIVCFLKLKLYSTELSLLPIGSKQVLLLSSKIGL